MIRPMQEPRADLYQRASAQTFAVLQQAAMDAIDTCQLVASVIEALEVSDTIDPGERTAIIARLQQIPAVASARADQHQQEDQG